MPWYRWRAYLEEHAESLQRRGATPRRIDEVIDMPDGQMALGELAALGVTVMRR